MTIDKKSLHYWLGLLLGCACFAHLGAAAEPLVHGLWVWKTSTVLDTPASHEALRHFCRTQRINEVYLSITRKDAEAWERQMVAIITALHQSGVKVEALFGSADADRAGAPREKLLEQVRTIIAYNQQHRTNRFDGIHLDIEPHQRPENKGAGNLKFLPDLVATYRTVRELAEPAGMTVNADIANKFLKGNLNERKALLTSVPRVTLMLYELSSPTDGASAVKKAEKLRRASENCLKIAYEGLTEKSLAKMGIALRTPDYQELLPEMLALMDTAQANAPHYLGWARHSYNDLFKPAP